MGAILPFFLDDSIFKENPMRVVKSPQAMQRFAKGWRREGIKIVLVPTMGFLHEGHLSLIRRARRAAGCSGHVVVSIYVNPDQFGKGEDLARYPRDLPRDLRLCRELGVDAAFTPDETSMLVNDSSYSTFIIEEQLSAGMEGISRPVHFRGVATIVARLFNISLPNAAVFGAKDFQQAAVIRRMTANLNYPVRIIVAPTVREPDGLALSSRNQLLTTVERQEAIVLWKVICAARKAVREAKGPIPKRRLENKLRRIAENQSRVRLDYMAFFDSSTFEPVRRVSRGTHMALAAFVGQVRLIDNSHL